MDQSIHTQIQSGYHLSLDSSVSTGLLLGSILPRVL